MWATALASCTGLSGSWYWAVCDEGCYVMQTAAGRTSSCWAAAVSLLVQVWVEQLCGRLLSHDRASYAAEQQEQNSAMRLIITRIKNIADSLHAVQQTLRDARAKAAEAAAAVSAAAASGSNPLVAASAAEKDVKTYEQQTLSMVGQMVNEFEQLRKTKANMSRLALVEYIVSGPGAIEWGRKLAGIQVCVRVFLGRFFVGLLKKFIGF